MKNTYLKLGALAAALVIVITIGGYLVTQSSPKAKAAPTKTTAQTGGYAVASVAGAAMAYFYNASGSGYTLGLVSCDGSGPSYSCIVIAQDSNGQQACGKIPFKFTRDGHLALGTPVTQPVAKCGG